MTIHKGVSFTLACVGLFWISSVCDVQAKQADAKKVKVDRLSQCTESGKEKSDPDTWSTCCKKHGGKVKGKDWNCDEESDIKAKEKAKLKSDPAEEEDLDESLPSEDEDSSELK